MRVLRFATQFRKSLIETLVTSVEFPKNSKNFNKSFYHDGYEDAYYLGYSDAKNYNNLEPLADDEEDAIYDLVYTIAIDNWGADYELVEDSKFINEVVRGYNDGIMDYREKDSNRKYSRKQ